MNALEPNKCDILKANMSIMEYIWLSTKSGVFDKVLKSMDEYAKIINKKENESIKREGSY